MHFVVEFLPGKLKEMIQSGRLEKDMKLADYISTTNMHCFDSEGRITKYANAEDILKEFYHLRIVYYEKRKVKENTIKLIFT